MNFHLISLLVVLIVAAPCLSQDTEAPTDAATEAATNAATNAATDAATDAATNAATDAAPQPTEAATSAPAADETTAADSQQKATETPVDVTSASPDDVQVAGKDRKFKSLKKWHEDFQTRLAALKKDIPSSSNDYKTELKRLDILKRIADVVRRDGDSHNQLKRRSESQGEWFLRDLENRLNNVGRLAKPMRWQSVKCGLKHRRLYTCGSI